MKACIYSRIRGARAGIAAAAVWMLLVSAVAIPASAHAQTVYGYGGSSYYQQYQQPYHWWWPWQYYPQYPQSYYPYYYGYGQLRVSCSPNSYSGSVGSYVTWTASASGGNGSYSYSWSGDGLNGYTTYTPAIATYYLYPGSKYAAVSVTSDGQTASASCGSVYIQPQYYYQYPYQQYPYQSYPYQYQY